MKRNDFMLKLYRLQIGAYCNTMFPVKSISYSEKYEKRVENVEEELYDNTVEY